MEDCIYEINESIDIIEDREITVYGISVYQSNSDLSLIQVERVDGITSEYSFIKEILNYLTEYKPSPVHFKDVINDILAK